METVDNQSIKDDRPFMHPPKRKTSVQADHSPVIISKKWLCQYLGISLTSSQRAERLRRCVATPNVLSQLNISIEQWNQRSDFTVEESNILRDVLRLP